MNLHYLNRLPDRGGRVSRNGNNKLSMLLLDFYNSDADYAEVEFNHGEYATSMSLYSGIQKAINTMNLPLTVEMIRGGVYLKREE